MAKIYPKVYSSKTLKFACDLLESDALTLKGIMTKIGSSRVVFHRNMEVYYGKIKWDSIIRRYMGRRGIQPGESRGLNTQFKEGRISNPKKWKPIGSFQIKVRKFKSEGRGRSTITRVRWVKIANAPYGKNNWIEYARYVWIKKHGPIPDGMCIVHLDMNTLNDEDIDNLNCMTRVQYLNYIQNRFPEKHKKAAKKRSRTLTGLRREKVAVKLIVECVGCSYQPETKIDICPKCNSGSFERVKVLV